jgi:hypothetical protein
MENSVSIAIVRQYFDRCIRICYRGKTFNEQLPSDRQGIADLFTGRYLVTHFPSRDRCVATVLHVTLYMYIFRTEAVARSARRITTAVNLGFLDRSRYFSLYPQKLALTSPTSGGRSVGIVGLRTKNHGVLVFYIFQMEEGRVVGCLTTTSESRLHNVGW